MRREKKERREIGKNVDKKPKEKKRRGRWKEYREEVTEREMRKKKPSEWEK